MSCVPRAMILNMEGALKITFNLNQTDSSSPNKPSPSVSLSSCIMILGATFILSANDYDQLASRDAVRFKREMESIAVS